jgi:uncharacterized protein
VKVVLDTNILISALIWGGLPAQLIQAAVDEKITLYTSPQLLSELREVINRPHLAARLLAKQSSAAQALMFYQGLAISVSPLNTPRVVPTDADDDHVVAAAVAARANIIVSGDSDLLNLGAHQGIKILAPAMALHQLNQNQ